MKATAQPVIDQLLVMRCQDGDAEAFAEIVDRCQRLFWSHALHLTGDQEGAWEVVQEAWLAIIRGMNRLQDPARFRPWAYRILTHKAADWVRRRAADRGRTRARPADPPALETDSQTDRSLDVREQLARLPREQRAILTLIYLEQFSVAEVARILDIPEGTVKSRLFNARKAIRGLMEQRHEKPS